MGASGLEVVRGPDHGHANDVLADACGGRAGLDGVLGDLDRMATFHHGNGPGVAWAFRWDREDEWTRRWWPQGITGSGDATMAEDGHRSVVVTTAYRKGRGGANEGSRLSVVDLRDPATIRYRHVLLVTVVLGEGGRPIVRPVHAHAGGALWRGRLLHVAATRAGFHTFRLDDIVLAHSTGAFIDETGLPGGGPRYLLPLAFTHRARTAGDVPPFRYSFLSLAHAADGHPGRRLVAGEYAHTSGTRRLLAYELDGTGLPAVDESGVAGSRWVEDTGLLHMQGAVHALGAFYVSASNGHRRGRLWTGRPGRWSEVPGGLPRGPEDMSYWPARDQLLTLTEHRGHRLVLALDRSRLT